MPPAGQAGQVELAAAYRSLWLQPDLLDDRCVLHHLAAEEHRSILGRGDVDEMVSRVNKGTIDAMREAVANNGVRIA